MQRVQSSSKRQRSTIGQKKSEQKQTVIERPSEMRPINWNVRCCGYLSWVLDPQKRKQAIKDCIESLKPHANKFEAIAVSGYSMALIAPTIADHFDKGLIIVRKEEDDCASHFRVEGLICNKYIMIDDLICSGDTLKRIKGQMEEHHHSPAKLYGIYLYNIAASAYRNHEQVKRHLGTLLLNTEENVELQLKEAGKC